MSSIDDQVFNPDTTPPSTPAALVATASGQSRINLSCAAVSDTAPPKNTVSVGLRGYRWYVAASAGGPFTLLRETVAPNTAQTGLAPATTRHYRVSAVDKNGNESPVSASVQATTATATPDAPTITFTVDDAAIVVGESITLTWSTTNADTLTASGAWSGSKALSGSQQLSPTPAGAYAYTLTATGPGGTVARTVNVQVEAAPPAPEAPTLTLAVVPSAIITGASATISWSTTNATGCTASGAWSGAKPTSGSEIVSPGTSSTYSLTATGPGGSVTRSTTLSVNQPPVESIGSFAWDKIPEIVFIAGLRDTKPLGTFMLDPANLVEPGPTWYLPGGQPLQRHARQGGGQWAPATNRRPTIVGGLPPGVSFSSVTATFTYDGPADQVGDRIVQAQVTVDGEVVSSETFRIRVLKPSMIWGHNAAAANIWGLAASQVFDYQDISLNGATRASRHTGTDAAPFVCFVTPGEYDPKQEITLFCDENPTDGDRREIAAITRASPAVVTFTTPHRMTTKSGSPFTKKPATLVNLTGDWVELNGRGLSAVIVDDYRIAVYWQGSGEPQVDEDGDPVEPELDPAQQPVDTSGYAADYAGGAQGFVGVRAWNMAQDVGANDADYTYIVSAPGGIASFWDRYADPSLQNWDPGYSNQFSCGMGAQRYDSGARLYLGRIELRGTVLLEQIMNVVYGGPSDVIAHASRFRFSWGRSDDGFGPWMDDAPAIGNGIDDNGITSVRRGLPLAANPCRLWLDACDLRMWMGSEYYHWAYQHGRPNGGTFTNGCRMEGKGAGSMVKGTHWYFYARTSEFWCFDREFDGVPILLRDGSPSLNNNGNPRTMDTRTGKALDTCCVGDIRVFGNRFISRGSGPDARTTDCIWLTGRRSLWGASDGSAYPNVTYQAAPFAPFRLQFGNSGLLDPNATNVRLEGRPVGSGAAYQTIATTSITKTVNALNRVVNWIVLVDPAAVESGAYQLRMAADGFAGKEPPKFTQTVHILVHKSPTYLLVSGMQFWLGMTEVQAWSEFGPRRYAIDDGQAFYEAMRGPGDAYLGLLDNPYTVKVFVSYNEFVNSPEPGSTTDLPARLVKIDGDYPRNAVAKGSTASKWGLVPPNWFPRTQLFFANNWTPGYTNTHLGAEANRCWISLADENEFGAEGRADVWVSGPVEGRMPNPPGSKIFGVDADGNITEEYLLANSTPAGDQPMRPLPAGWKL